MAYRDDNRPMCPACDAALEPMELKREIDINFRPHNGLLPPRPPLQLAPWTQWTCSACHGTMLEADHLAMLVDQAAGDVRALASRWSTVDKPGRRCPSCAGAMTTMALAGVELERCPRHGAWLAAGVLDRVLAAVQPLPDP